VSTDLPVLRNFVGGSYVDPAEPTSRVVDPCSGEAYARAPVSGAETVATAMAAAEAGFEAWRDTTPAERQRALLRIADAVDARADEIIAAECRNTGKPVELTRSEEMAPLLDELHFGAVWINTHLPFVSEMPHGGFGHSGYGKDLSMYGFEEYTRIKHVMSHLG
jgi:betaine-aldehyde dehydrogenase